MGILMASDRGRFAELFSAAAFAADGVQLAFPLSISQVGWDYLILMDGEWKRVQVKTATIRDTGAPRLVFDRPVTLDEADLVVAVFPASGTLWKFPAEEVLGKKTFTLSDKWIWIGAKQEEFHMGPPVVFQRRSCTPSLKNRLSAVIPQSRPDEIKPENWDMLQLWINGLGYDKIAGRYGLNYSTVVERIRRSAFRILGDTCDSRTVMGREEVKRLLPVERPPAIKTEEAWQLLVDWANGVSYAKLAMTRGVGYTAIQKKLRRARANIGLWQKPPHVIFGEWSHARLLGGEE